ncbi:MAG: hypothetical protein V3R90_09425, partial [Limibaculum sp.]
MKTITREPFDYDACRERLRAITTDAAALDSFERVAQSGKMESEFLEAVARLNISLDHVFLGTGEPFLMEKTHDKGRVLMFATSANVRWSDLPKRKVFIPLVHQCVRHL